MTLYEKIDDLRKKNGMTWAYLNKEIGGYRGKLTEMKKDKTTLTDSEITILADRLRTTKDYLLGHTDDPAPSGAETNKVPIEEIGPNKKALLDAISDMSESEMLLLLDRIQKIKESR